MLSEQLTAQGIHHTVCVATDCGAEVMEKSPYADIHVGRMNIEEMKEFIKGVAGSLGCILVDATHPYAVEATANIREAAKLQKATYIRVIRAETCDLPDSAALYSDIEECAREADKTTGNILLTTGSKELSKYCKGVSRSTRERTFVRVLPTKESIELCRDLGVETDHIIAMQGPFGSMLNEAVIRQYDIRHLITKDSGAAGGMEEKISAAANTGAMLHVIKRPCSEDGVSVFEAFRLITGKEMPSGISCNGRENGGAIPLKITLAGIGMGTDKTLTMEAFEAVRSCDILFGAERVIKNLTCPKKYEMYRSSDIIPVLERENVRHAVIAFSGDSSFYSGAGNMLLALKNWRSDIDVRILPGISSVSYLAAKLGENYDDAVLFSLHGRSSDKNLDALIEKIRFNEKTFVLLSGAEDLRRIAKRLSEHVPGCRIFAGINLSYEDERIRELEKGDEDKFDEKGVITAFIRNPKPSKRAVISIRRDRDFLRSKVPMTKECVRHESLIRLGLREGDTFYDIGGGTGSVAIEAASLDQSIDVYTFEKKPEAADLIRQNIEKTGVSNVTVIEGNAQDKLSDMKKPDCVFIGGSSGGLSEIVDILHSKGDGIRFVINAVSLETIEEVKRLTKQYEPSDEEAVMLSVSEIEAIGSHHMMRGQNPVWIFSFLL